MLRLFLLGALMPLLAHAQHLDSLHLMVDAEASDNTPYTFRTFQDATSHFVDGTTVYIRPGVYWIDDPDDPEVKVPTPHSRWNGKKSARCSIGISTGTDTRSHR